ncbi:MAG: hypothetical protein GTN62_12110 [Gemmatimonadales bacterium]|nr:hypothetical protein [Gemmatimonadales bacterium]NIN12464.1 hypothetical protein [Gemmatimonadales bacterium]NIN50840.1 hypothetical protein [Gemmatimonadales bacterium]NIP08304.1 hypothetical protein [Gemmatimonadales bacterium]NIR00828.1 hypothetical protein [Gemmatimonadales bacterium]
MPTANPSSSKSVTAKRGARRRPQAEPGRAMPLRPIVEWLADLGTTDHWVVSCYLKLEPRDRSRGKYLIKLKNRSKERLAWLESRGVGRQIRETVARDLERIRTYLEHPGNVRTGQGIALFACEPLELFEAVPLPRVFRSRLSIDRSPLIRELAALDDEFGLVLCAMYDRTSGRFFQVTAFGIEELPSLAAGDATRAGRFHGGPSASGRGRGHAAAGEHNYHQRIREQKQRHYANVAQRLFDASREHSIRGIVLAGMGADAGAVMPHLHPYLAKQVLGATKLNPKTASPAEVMEAVLAVRRDSEREWETEHVRALYEGLGTGWAVNGLEPALRALAHGQVRTLLVDPTVEQVGFRCTQTGRLSAGPDGCRGEGDAEPVADVVDEAIEEALRQGCHVEVVEDSKVRTQVDGLAALLRFKKR